MAGSSIRTKFQAVVVVLALSAIGVSVWISSADASAALREATADRLRAVRETKQHALERYFEDLGRHVTALSTSEATIAALRDFELAWSSLGAAGISSMEERRLREYYTSVLAAQVPPVNAAAALFIDTWFPSDTRTRQLQYHLIAKNPHPVGSKDLLLEVPEVPAYGEAHARHHPTFHRYQTAFGFYDIFLISAVDGRLLYSVMKEVDLGVPLTAEPYRSTRLGRAFARAARPSAPDDETAVLEDFAPYFASGFAPAAFIAAPVRVAGATVGVLAMQLSIREVDRVMTGGQNWRGEGLGDSGQAYAVGPDGTLRSDLREQIEHPDTFLRGLGARGIAADTLARIRHDGTTVLNLRLDGLHPSDDAIDAESGTDLLGRAVLRSRAPLDVPDLAWTVVAEIGADEALAPVRALQTRLLMAGLALAGLFFVVAGWLGASVTRPVLELARTVARLEGGDRGATVTVRSRDEVGQLAGAFNRMSEVLARTTVSKSELEVLAGRLISAQEDERRRVARELHDDLVQRVAATAIEVGRLEQVPSDAERKAGVGVLKQTLARLAQDVHGLSRRIHPAMLEERGLPASLEAECRAFTERGGPPVDLRVHGSLDGLPRDVTLALYRIVQEALRNTWQHANASDVSIALERTGGTVSLRIADNGRGFDRSAPSHSPGLGLASMEERVRLLGGTLHVESAPGRGTQLDVAFPVNDHDTTTHPAR